MQIYDLLEYSENYSRTPLSFWNFNRNEINDSSIDINNDGNMINKYKTIACVIQKYKTKIIGKTPNDHNRLDTDVIVSLT